MNNREDYIVEGDAVKYIDKGAWAGLIVVPRCESIWERQSFLCAYPLSSTPLKFKYSMQDKMTKETIFPETAIELSKANIRNLYWDYLEKEFRSYGFSEQDIRVISREWNEEFNVKDLISSDVLVDYSKSPVDKNYGRIINIVYLKGTVHQKFMNMAKKIVRKYRESKPQNTCKDITY